MFYDKLPIMILAELVSGDMESINARLARYILSHLDEVQSDSIRTLAEKTYVSASSISRFCRDIGLSDFMELKQLLSSTSLRFEIESHDPDPEIQKQAYISSVEESLERVRNSVNAAQLYRLAADIYQHENILICGILKGETAAMNLQTDLTMLGKRASTKLRYSQQVELLHAATPDDLLILFSFTGIFFDYGYPAQGSGKRPKTWFITSDNKARQNRAFDEVIWFDSQQNQASHPWQLQMVASLIAQSYAHYRQEHNNN